MSYGAYNLSSVPSGCSKCLAEHRLFPSVADVHAICLSAHGAALKQPATERAHTPAIDSSVLLPHTVQQRDSNTLRDKVGVAVVHLDPAQSYNQVAIPPQTSYMKCATRPASYQLESWAIWAPAAFSPTFFSCQGRTPEKKTLITQTQRSKPCGLRETLGRKVCIFAFSPHSAHIDSRIAAPLTHSASKGLLTIWEGFQRR